MQFNYVVFWLVMIYMTNLGTLVELATLVHNIKSVQTVPVSGTEFSIPPNPTCSNIKHYCTKEYAMYFTDLDSK